MANQLVDNTYMVDAAGATALSWPARARISQVRIHAVSTAADVLFQIGAGSPVFRFNVLLHAGSMGSAVGYSHQTFPLGGVSFPTAWIPSILVAATAWIDFA